MHICVSNLAIIGSDNGLSPGRCQAIVWTNAGILLIGPLETNFSEILNVIYIFPFKKMHLKISSGKWRPFCLGHNVLTHCGCNLKWIIFKIISQIDIVPVKLTSGEATRSHWWLINIRSGNGLVPSGNKPLPKPMLTKSHDVLSLDWITRPQWVNGCSVICT